MADKPMGFRPAYTTHGGPPSVEQCKISGGVVIYQGDVLIMETGRVLTLTSTSTSPYGVAGAFTDSTDWDTRIPVYNDLKNTIFIAQTDASAILGTSLCGPEIHYDIAAATGSTISGLSNYEIDDNASNCDHLYIIDKVNRPDNAWGANVDVYCKFLVDVTALTSLPTGT